MSLAEIEAELEKLTPEELRHLAMKSWSVFVEKQGHAPYRHECVEDDPALLEALDEAVATADSELNPRAALELFYKQIIKRRAIPFPLQADTPEDEVLSPASRRNALADEF